MVLVDGEGTPLGLHLDSATPQEITLLKPTLETVSVARRHHPGRPRMKPDRLILDRGYDSNPLRGWLPSIGIEPILPATRAHPYATHQDGRTLRRYRRRWIVERTFAWLGSFRRLLVRHERDLENYRAFFHVACAMLALRRVLE